MMLLDAHNILKDCEMRIISKSDTLASISKNERRYGNFHHQHTRTHARAHIYIYSTYLRKEMRM